MRYRAGVTPTAGYYRDPVVPNFSNLIIGHAEERKLPTYSRIGWDPQEKGNWTMTRGIHGSSSCQDPNCLS